MRKIENSDPTKAGLALEDVSELFTVCNVLQDRSPDLAEEIRGAIGEVVGKGGAFAEVQMFGEDASLTLRSLNRLAEMKATERRIAKNPALPGFKLAAWHMITEYLYPGAREETAAISAAHERALADQGAAPYQERLISGRVEQRIAEQPSLDFGTEFKRLAALELDEPAKAAGDTIYDPSVAEPETSFHSDRIRVLVK